LDRPTAAGIDDVSQALAVLLVEVAIVARGGHCLVDEIDAGVHRAAQGIGALDPDSPGPARRPLAPGADFAAHLDQEGIPAEGLQGADHLVHGEALGDGRQIALDVGVPLADRAAGRIQLQQV
jgi:hypothetical protein